MASRSRITASTSLSIPARRRSSPSPRESRGLTGITAHGSVRRSIWKCADACSSKLRAKPSVTASILPPRQNPQPLPQDLMNKRKFIFAVATALIAGGLLVASLRLPLWHMRMEAPQYKDQEALKVFVLPGSLHGDLNEIKVLNKYI